MRMPTLDRHWTVDDINALPDDGNRYEVIDGELFVTPAPIARHQVAVGELFARLRDYLRREPIGYAFVSPADIVFSPRRSVQPDVFVVPLVNGRRPESWSDVHTLLVAAEVISPSSRRADRIVKRALFRDEGVAEYWVVDVDARTIERSTPAGARTEAINDQLVWSPRGAREPFTLALAEYFGDVLG